MKKWMKAFLILALVVFLGNIAFAQETKPNTDSKDVKAYLALSIGFGLAISVFGGALGQSKAISAAVEAIARQPEAGGRIQGAMIIGLALIETLVIYMLLICFLLLGKFGG